MSPQIEIRFCNKRPKPRNENVLKCKTTIYECLLSKHRQPNMGPFISTYGYT